MNKFETVIESQNEFRTVSASLELSKKSQIILANKFERASRILNESQGALNKWRRILTRLD